MEEREIERERYICIEREIEREIGIEREESLKT
jgi:hypothetical protein